MFSWVTPSRPRPEQAALAFVWHLRISETRALFQALPVFPRKEKDPPQLQVFGHFFTHWKKLPRKKNLTGNTNASERWQQKLSWWGWDGDYTSLPGCFRESPWDLPRNQAGNFMKPLSDSSLQRGVFLNEPAIYALLLQGEGTLNVP